MASIIKVDQIEPNTQQMVAMKIGGQANYMIPSFVGQLTSFRLRRAINQAFPFWNLALPDQTIPYANYPDYVDYLRSIKIETCNPIQFTQTITMSGSPTTTATFNAVLSSTLTVGTLLYFHSSGQFRIIVGVTSNTVYTLDEAISGSALVVSSIDQSTYSSTFTGSWTSATQFTLADNAQNRILLDALTEDAYYGGASISSGTITPINNTNWLILRWGTTDINITSFNPTTRVINVASGTPSGTTIELYPHRITDSGDARHKQVEDSVLINNGMQVVNGLRLRDRIQGHRHSITDPGHSHLIYGFNDAVNDAFPTLTGSSQGWVESTASAGTGISISDSSSDGTNGNPRTGQFTRPRGLGIYFYEYVGRVI